MPWNHGSYCTGSADHHQTRSPPRPEYKIKKSPVPPFFDLIFLDPPYGQGLAQKTLENINNSSLCGPDTLVIAEESSGVVLPDSFSRLILSDQRRYGDTTFWFYTLKDIGQPSTF